MNQKQVLIIITILVAFPTLCQCDDNLRDYWPTKNWKYSQPEKQGLQTNIIISMGKYILTNIPTIDSVIIVRHGYIIFEQYLKKSSEDLRVLQSVTKSVVSSLLGIAIDLGLVINLDQKMIDFFPECNDSSIDSSIREITLHNLLTMSASFTVLPDPNFLKDVFTLPLVRKPGTHFHYDAPDPELISLIISKVSSLSAAEFAYKYLFRPIGITKYSWHGSRGYSHGHTGLSLKPRDMAKLGYLYLNHGIWNGQQIISQKWIEESTINQIADLQQTDSNPESYGYFWWIGEMSGYGFYSAVGDGGQAIAVVPDLDIVLVTTGTGVINVAYEILLKDFIIPAVRK